MGSRGSSVVVRWLQLGRESLDRRWREPCGGCCMAKPIYLTVLLWFYPLMQAFVNWSSEQHCEKHWPPCYACGNKWQKAIRRLLIWTEPVTDQVLRYCTQQMYRKEALDACLAYWQAMGPLRLGALHKAMWPVDRAEVVGLCWREGRIRSWFGMEYVDCEHTQNHCGRELVYDILAAYILMPEPWWVKYMNSSTEELARLFDCEQWTVRFRRALYQVTGK